MYMYVCVAEIHNGETLVTGCARNTSHILNYHLCGGASELRQMSMMSSFIYLMSCHYVGGISVRCPVYEKRCI